MFLRNAPRAWNAVENADNLELATHLPVLVILMALESLMKQDSIAARVCLFLKCNRSATRPQLQRELKLNEKALESAIRKLLRLRILINTGRRCREGGSRPAHIFELGPVEFDQSAYSTCFLRRGRPLGAREKAILTDTPSCDELMKVMRAIVQPLSSLTQED